MEDQWQDQGVGIALSRELIEAAKDQGVRCFYALVLGKNRRMIELLRHLDLPEQEHENEEAKRIEVKLPSERH